MFDVSIPEPLAFWVPATPIEFTSLGDDTKITIKMDKADKVTDREGHSTDKRWGMILHPRKDDTHYMEMATDALLAVVIVINPDSVKEMRNKITTASRCRTTFKFTYNHQFNKKMINKLRDQKHFKIKKSKNEATIVLSLNFCTEMDLCP